MLLQSLSLGRRALASSSAHRANQDACIACLVALTFVKTTSKAATIMQAKVACNAAAGINTD